MPSSNMRVALLAGCLLAANQAGAQEPGLRLAPSAKSSPDKSLPTTVSARRIDGVADKETTAEGDVLLRRGNRSIAADWLRFSSETDLVEAKGNVRVEQEDAVLTGPSLRLRTSDSIGSIENPSYTFKPQPKGNSLPVTVRGAASRIDLEGEELYRLINATFTTCIPGDDSWYLQVEELSLDFGREVGNAQWATMFFHDTAILKLPFLDFSLNSRRKSGFLAPTVATSGKNGPEISLPYYFNLAPNRDLTVTPRYMAKRGLIVASEFRYLEPGHRGNAKLEYLPEDQIRGGQRTAMSLVHGFDSGPYSAGLSLNKVSDNDYFRDLSSRLNFVSQSYLPREGFFTYKGNFWDSGTYIATARSQSFQTLQLPNAPLPVQYARLPQVTVAATRPDYHGTDLTLNSEFVDFHHPSQVRGLRTMINPSIALPILTPGAYVTPKIGLHATTYSLTNAAPGTATSIQRTLPIFSVDSGLTFERDASYFGQAFQQTLEPRAYYLYIPYRDQRQIPLFDTAVADFNYAQIFSEHGFTGNDRVNDANQLTLAMTSRLLSPTTGQEAFRATIAQRYYFARQQVTLDPASQPRDFFASNWLASVAGRVAQGWTVEGATQYNNRESRVDRLTLGTRYQPAAQKTLNLSYRFLRDQFNQVDVSSQWPVSGRVYGVGRYNYSVRDHRLVEALAGFEYNADCWVGRLVFHTFAVAPGQQTRGIFLQLELNGFSRIGSNPLDTLRRAIPGYMRLNQTLNPGRTGDYDDY